jgi:DNA-binding MarR family transcriptional regulator
VTPEQEFTSREYLALADFRHQLRRFLKFSEDAARSFGIEPGQHQLLLALRGFSEDSPPTVGALAERLLLRQHSVVGLLDRLEARNMVRRERAEGDRRQVLVRLAPSGEEVLRQLSLHHRAELRTAGPALARALRELLKEGENGKERPPAA